MKNKGIPKLVKELRDKFGLIQEQFAQKVVVSFPTINTWEKGIMTSSPFLFQRFVEIAEENELKNIQNIGKN